MEEKYIFFFFWSVHLLWRGTTLTDQISKKLPMDFLGLEREGTFVRSVI